MISLYNNVENDEIFKDITRDKNVGRLHGSNIIYRVIFGYYRQSACVCLYRV